MKKKSVSELWIFDQRPPENAVSPRRDFPFWTYLRPSKNARMILHVPGKSPGRKMAENPANNEITVKSSKLDTG